MLVIILQNLPLGIGLKGLAKIDFLFDHFLLRMLGNTDILLCGLGTEALQHNLQVNCI